MADFSSIMRSAPIGLFMLFGTYLAARRRKSGWAKARGDYPDLAKRLGLAHKAPAEASRVGTLKGSYRDHDVFVDPDERPRVVVYLTGAPAVLLRSYVVEKRTPANWVRLETGDPWLDSYFKDRYASPTAARTLRDEGSELSVLVRRVLESHPERVTQLSVTSERLECVLDFGRPPHIPADTVERLLPDLLEIVELVEAAAPVTGAEETRSPDAPL